jgi:hypothetical protein
MAPANYTSSSLKNPGGFPAGGEGSSVAGPAPAVNPATIPGATGIAREGGKGPKRIAPTQVNPSTGQALAGPFGSTIESAVQHARTLSAQQRRDETARLERGLKALTMIEDEVCQEDMKDEETDYDEDEPGLSKGGKGKGREREGEGEGKGKEKGNINR